MKVLVADTFESSGLEGLRAAGCDLLYQPDLNGESLTQALRTADPDVLVVRSTKVTDAMLDAGTRLSLVVRAGAGVNTIDVTAAARRGIYVSNCPGRNSMAVAELTIGLLIALDRRIPDNVAELRAGRWKKKAFSAGARGLFGRTLGLIGFGNIGQEVARRALGLGMDVIVWSPRFLREGALALAALPRDLEVTVLRTPEEVAGRCDALSVHLALTSDTTGFVGASILSRLRPGTLFVNTARAELVDEAALTQAVETGRVRAGLDVFPGEPAAGAAEFSSPLAALPGVYGTHHIGASTEQAQEAIAAEAVRVIRTYRDTGQVPNVVNLALHTPATHTLIVRHRDRPGVLADVFTQLRLRNLNVQETENVIFEGAEAAVARISLDAEPDEALLTAIRSANPDVLSLQVVKR